jgi:mRNA interferase RelE/StbE
MFQVLYSPGAGKALQKMPKEAAIRIVEALEALSKADDPKRNMKKLKGSFGVPIYSYRVGNYRIILSLSEEVLAIYVIDVGDRSTIYRNY